MEQFERIRRDARDEGLSIRALADATPPPRKTPVRVAPVLGRHVGTVRGWLTADLAAPRKQRQCTVPARLVRSARCACTCPATGPVNGHG